MKSNWSAFHMPDNVLIGIIPLIPPLSPRDWCPRLRHRPIFIDDGNRGLAKGGNCSRIHKESVSQGWVLTMRYCLSWLNSLCLPNKTVIICASFQRLMFVLVLGWDICIHWDIIRCRVMSIRYQTAALSHLGKAVVIIYF